MNKKNWKGVPIEKIRDWQISFGAESKGFVVPGPCPVCGQNSLRRYYHLGHAEAREIRGIRYRGKGSVWEWCSSCGAYSHSQAYVPETWGDIQLDVDHSKLTPVPDVIDHLISSLT